MALVSGAVPTVPVVPEQRPALPASVLWRIGGNPSPCFHLHKLLIKSLRQTVRVVHGNDLPKVFRNNRTQCGEAFHRPFFVRSGIIEECRDRKEIVLDLE